MVAALLEPQEAVTPAALLEGVSAARAAADDAETRVLEFALEWAYAHPEPTTETDPRNAHPITGEVVYAEPAPREDEESGTWFGLPLVRWDAPAAFAAANRMSTQQGARLIRDALALRHRLPRTWARVVAREVPAWRARRVADTIAGQPDDVAAYVDEQVHGVAEAIGLRTLDRLLDEALLRLHAEERELDQLAALDARHATLHPETINDTGIAEMTLRCDYIDLAAFDDTLGNLAHALRDPELAELAGIREAAAGTSGDVRRALAVGVLADPQLAARLLSTTGPTPTDPVPTTSTRRRETVLHVHVSDTALLGLDPVARLEAGGGAGIAVLAEQVREWCGRTDGAVKVLPTVAAGERVAVESYEIPERLRRRVLADHLTCTFPWCERFSRRCDLDHIVPWQRGGATSTDNLAPLCRHHHRLKTHAGWRYQRLDEGLYLWTSPQTRHYLRTPHGTRAVSAPLAPA